MRISDWSSYVCSSDLHPSAVADAGPAGRRRDRHLQHIPEKTEGCGDIRSADVHMVDADDGHGPLLCIFLRVGFSLLSRPTRPSGRQGRTASSTSRSEEHTSELQSLMRISYAVFCLKKKKNKHTHHIANHNNPDITSTSSYLTESE